MRMVFGLGSLLIVIFIILWVMAGPGGNYLGAVASKQKEARSEAEVIAGVDENGMRNSESIVLDPVTSGTRTTALVVTSIVPTGPMAVRMNLATGDKILEVGPQRIRDIDDVEMAKALVYEASQRAQKLVIERNGARYEMPGLVPLDGAPVAGANSQSTPQATPAATVAPPAAPSEAAPSESSTPVKAPPQRSSIYDQVNQIPGVQK